MNDSVFLVNRLPRFGVEDSINYSMNIGAWLCRRDPDAYSRAALAQHDKLVDTLFELNCTILDVASTHGSYDRKFVCDHSAVIEDTIVVAKMSRAPRQPETAYVRPLVNEHHLFEFENPQARFEGGDCIDTPFTEGGKPIKIVAHSSRTNKAAHEELTGRFKKTAFKFIDLIAARHTGCEEQAAEARLYHVDTASHFRPSQNLVFHAPAFEKKAARTLEGMARDCGKSVYDLSAREARMMNANIFSVGDTHAITTKLSPCLERTLRDWGDEPRQHDLLHYILAGGAGNCLIKKWPQAALSTCAMQEATRQMSARRTLGRGALPVQAANVA